MKAGIITILNINNFGAELQAFALHNKLLRLGYNNEIINYLYWRHPQAKNVKTSAPELKPSLKITLKEKILKYLDKWHKIKYKKAYNNRVNKFIEFHEKNTKLSKTYYSFDDLYNSPPIYDVYIAGSDQIWNPYTPSTLKPYYLTFAPQDKKKMSYASSFGISHIPKEIQSTISSYINNIDIISCREKAGVDIIKNLTNRDAEHVLDPTLLLTSEEWNDVLIEPNIKEKYILIYELTNSKYIKELARKIQEVSNYRIVRICKNIVKKEDDQEIINLNEIGPAEYLGLFKSASFVLTNSFHGTVFSVLNAKPFYTITPLHKTNNSRQQGFLELLGLEDRLLKENAPMPDFSDLSLNFTLAHKKLDKERLKSVNYLVNAINQ